MKAYVWVLLDFDAPGEALREWRKTGEYTPAWVHLYANPGRALWDMEDVQLGPERFAQLEWIRHHRYSLEGQDEYGRQWLLMRDEVDGDVEPEINP